MVLSPWKVLEPLGNILWLKLPPPGACPSADEEVMGPQCEAVSAVNTTWELPMSLCCTHWHLSNWLSLIYHCFIFPLTSCSWCYFLLFVYKLDFFYFYYQNRSLLQFSKYNALISRVSHLFGDRLIFFCSSNRSINLNKYYTSLRRNGGSGVLPQEKMYIFKVLTIN